MLRSAVQFFLVFALTGALFISVTAGENEQVTTVTAATDAVAKPLPKFISLHSHVCKICKTMQPIIDEVEQQYQGKVVVERYDVKENAAPGKFYHIRLLPTQVFLNPLGEEVYRHEGFFPKDSLCAVLDSMIAKK